MKYMPIAWRAYVDMLSMTSSSFSGFLILGLRGILGPYSIAMGPNTTLDSTPRYTSVKNEVMYDESDVAPRVTVNRHDCMASWKGAKISLSLNEALKNDKKPIMPALMPSKNIEGLLLKMRVNEILMKKRVAMVQTILLSRVRPFFHDRGMKQFAISCFLYSFLFSVAKSLSRGFAS